jgi:ATP-binding cassette subfamily B protein
MDPARGRLWLPRHLFLKDLYVHSVTVPAAEWREWAGSTEFIAPLTERLGRLGLSARERDSHMAAAVADPSWAGLAALDASARVVARLRAVGTLSRIQAGTALSAFVAEAGTLRAESIPAHYWSVLAADRFGAECSRLHLRGAVLVRVRGRQPPLTSRARVQGRSALSEEPPRPIRTAVAALKADGVLEPALALAAAMIAAVGVAAEAVLLRSVLDARFVLTLPEQAAAATVALATFLSALLFIEFVIGAAERRAGRRLETRLRIALFEKIPALANAYMESRPVSDMVERVHSIHLLRALPPLATRVLRLGAELAITAAAIAWLSPQSAALVLATVVLAVGIPLVGHSALAERDLRVRTHVGALGRFQLEALLGRTALDAHGAGTALEAEHERLLSEWSRSALALRRGSVVIEGLQMTACFALAGWILLRHFTAANPAVALLLAYWVLNLPLLAYELALCVREYPACRNTLLRLLEPLHAPYGLPSDDSVNRNCHPSAVQSPGAHIALQRVLVRAGGHRILGEIDLEIESGSHVAIIGPSGAGKSTLSGLLLGWHRSSSGMLLIDGEPLTDPRLHAVRQQTAWVEPTVHIWNAPLLDNLLYGRASPLLLGKVLQATGLTSLLAKLPDGLATPLGEGGALLSAGEAQRVRLARAMLQPDVRLAVLDEAFLGLERDQRTSLLAEARQHWCRSTLLYVTHDIAEARSFERVLVLENGKIAEDGNPRMLARIASSRFRRLSQAQDAIQARFAGGEWRRVHLRDGHIVEGHGHTVVERTA